LVRRESKETKAIQDHKASKEKMVYRDLKETKAILEHKEFRE
jgi:hypothetical protein